MRKHWLILKDICKDEEAEYACQAINVAGEAWCFSDVVVHLSQGVVFCPFYLFSDTCFEIQNFKIDCYPFRKPIF